MEVEMESDDAPWQSVYFQAFACSPSVETCGCERETAELWRMMTDQDPLKPPDDDFINLWNGSKNQHGFIREDRKSIKEDDN